MRGVDEPWYPMRPFRTATVATGRGGAAATMRSRPIAHWWKLGYVPCAGSLNLEVGEEEVRWWRQQDVVRIGKADHVPVTLPQLYGIQCHLRFSARKDQVELVAPVHFRTMFGLQDGDLLAIHPRRHRTRVIIQAAGTQRRWNNHMGTPKHLVPVPRFSQKGDQLENEFLLERTVRLVRDTGIRDIVIMCPEGEADRYRIRGCELHEKRVTDDMPEADAWFPTTLWNLDGRTLFLSGDTYYTTRTLQQMVAYAPRGFGPVWYLRPFDYEWRDGWTRSKAILGLSIYDSQAPDLLEALLRAIELQDTEKIERSAGYELYRIMGGETLENLARPRSDPDYEFPLYPPNTWTPELDDATHDFDRPKDYTWFLQRFNPETDG